MTEADTFHIYVLIQLVKVGKMKQQTSNKNKESQYGDLKLSLEQLDPHMMLNPEHTGSKLLCKTIFFNCALRDSEIGQCFVRQHI